MMPHSIVTYLQYGGGSGWFSNFIATDDRNPSRDVDQAPDRALLFCYFCIAYVELQVNMTGLPAVPAKSKPFFHSDVYYIDAGLVSIDMLRGGCG